MGILGEPDGGVRKADFAGLLKRDPFSRYLPYRAFDDNTDEYINVDNTYGRLWECRPQAFFSLKVRKALVSLLRQELPKQSIIQFILYSDDHIDHILSKYVSLKTRDDESAQEAAQRYAQHLSAGRSGLSQISDIPIRNFRLFCSIKSPSRLEPETVARTEEALSSAQLYPHRLKPGGLLSLLRRLFNEHVPADAGSYSSDRYINTQIIDSDNPVEEVKGGMRFGGRYAACLTPKSLAPTADPLSVNSLIGGFMGLDDDSSQIKHRFLWSTSIFFKTTKDHIRGKSNLLGMQRLGGAAGRDLQRKKEENAWVLDEVANDPYCNVISSMWVFGKNEEDVNRAAARVRTLWESQGHVMQRETQIQRTMLVAALPFGLYTGGSNWNEITLMDRDFPMSIAAAATLLPVQSDFCGGMNPVMLFTGRKGQLITLDFFDRNCTSYNFYIAARTGVGKSVVTNALVLNYYAAGAKIRLTDLGYSYKKLCKTVGGRYIDVGEHIEKICVNPFLISGNPNFDAEDQKGNDEAVKGVVLTMIYSNTGTANVTETQVTLVDDAVRFARKRDGGVMGVDHVYEYLATYPKYDEDGGIEMAVELAKEMAFNLRNFTSKGRYGSLFNGKSNIHINSDDFVVFEMEELQHNPELFRVISLQVINAVTADLYLYNDRSQNRLILFDEAYKYLGINDASSSNQLISKVIEESYRRCRKMGGSTGIISQSALDLLSFGDAGKVIKSNSAFKLFLESESYPEAAREGVLGEKYDGLLLDILQSVKTVKPRYSEILLDTPFGCGVGRLVLDRFNYWAYTTDPKEVARYEAEVAGGLSPREALLKLSGVG